MGILLEAITITTEAINLLGASKVSSEFFKAAVELSKIYINLSLSLTKYLFNPSFSSIIKKNRYPDAKGII
jgi:hypothetical protein